jgi:von Willebrand factor type A domain
VIDNSGSMAASDVSPSRLGAARKRALETVEGLGMLDQAAIVVAGENPSVICGMTGHLPTLKTAIESIPQSDNSPA